MLTNRWRQSKRRRTGSKAPVSGGSVVPVSAARAESNLARKVLRIERLVRGLQAETKFSDVALSAANINTVTGVTLHMTAIGQGIAVNQRIGENIQVRHVEFHGELQYAGSAAAVVTDNPTYRVYIVQDLQQQPSVFPTLGDLVDQPSLPIVQLYNVAEQKRFRVLYDSGAQMWQIGSLAVPPLNSSIIAGGKFHLHLKKKVSIPVEFNGVGVGTIQKNGIYFMFSSDATTGVLDWTGSCRIGFTDV